MLKDREGNLWIATTDGVIRCNGRAFVRFTAEDGLLSTLLSNAIKFTETGEIKVAARQVDGQLELTVSDTGKGIPKSELPTLFDEYRQVEGSERRVQKGTGLGLSITRKFAELLGGTIRVESEVGKGSTFTVKVPSTYEG